MPAYDTVMLLWKSVVMGSFGWMEVGKSGGKPTACHWWWWWWERIISLCEVCFHPPVPGRDDGVLVLFRSTVDGKGNKSIGLCLGRTL